MQVRLKANRFNFFCVRQKEKKEEQEEGQEQEVLQKLQRRQAVQGLPITLVD